MVFHQGIAVISAELGGFDEQRNHPLQSIDADYFYFNDKNFPLRKSMTPRLQAKIPKMFGWQLKPGYEYYMWLDGNIVFDKFDALEYFYDQIQGYDIVVLHHHRRNTIKWEARYLERAINENSRYIMARYDNEFWQEQLAEIQADKDYKDDFMLIGGVFMYKNNEKVRQAMKEWWYQVSRYSIQDQISLPYVLRKAGLKIKILDHDYTKWDYIKREEHKKKYV